jgi:hypothetical protein
LVEGGRISVASVKLVKIRSDRILALARIAIATFGVDVGRK